MTILVATVCWVGVRGYLAKAELEQAQQLVAELKTNAAGMQLEALGPTFDELAGHAATARGLTSDPIWRAFEWVPVLGQNLTVVRELAATTDDTVQSIGPLVKFAATLNPAALAPVDGAIPLQPIVDAVPLVQDAATELAALQKRAISIDSSFAIGPVSDAKAKFIELMSRTVAPLTEASTLVPLLPAMLGSDGPRSYVVMFQNNAEARSLGGTALSFALISVDHGKIALQETIPAGFDNFPQLEESIIPVPDGFEQIFPGAFGRFIPNATLRPSFPSAAAITLENWSTARGIRPDGIVSLDAVALSYVLRATGAVSLSSGDVLDGDNVVRVLFNEVLQRYNSGDPRADNAAQDVVYSEAVAQTFSRISSGQFDMPTLLLSVFKGFTERRFSYWSADPAQQTLIADAGLANDLPTSDDDTDAIGVYVNDNVGSKLNYYLRTRMTTSSAACGNDGRTVHRVEYGVESTLKPEEVPGLSPSIVGEFRREGLDPGVQRLLLLVYAPPGSSILDVKVDGEPIEFAALHDTDYPVARVVVLVPPGGQSTMSVDVMMGAPGSRALDVQLTPLIASPLVSESSLDCGTVSLPPGE